MTEHLNKHAEHLDQSERRVSEVEDGQTQLATSHVKLNKELNSLRLKVDDLEARSRRNNLRTVGVAESTTIDNMEGFIERLLVQLLGRTTFSDLFVVERAHRSLATHPPPGAPPRPIIARLLNYRDGDAALRRARQLKTLHYEGMTVSLYPYFTLQRDNHKKLDQFIKRRVAVKQAGVLKSIRGRLQLLEPDQAQLEQDHQYAAVSQTLGHIHATLLEFQDTALEEVQHLAKYATARAYGEGERPSSLLANLINPNREKDVIIFVQAGDGSELRDTEHILARFCEYYQSLYTSMVTPDHEALLDYLTHITMPRLTDADRETLMATLMLEEMDGALGGMAEGKARALMG
ncbi:hypothetical protein NDU88_003975 [Pleurodeles waltl]|uniref:Uncharacterized protein n=1 Tax=Pleurodeles waltl TaxID=8319 RepID=A0AAV7QAI8_PLEWA|nr:hypothetical protein NDU88_003975 [Pleurodeles waltl]